LQLLLSSVLDIVIIREYLEPICDETIIRDANDIGGEKSLAKKAVA
jgi:hypothetical protein